MLRGCTIVRRSVGIGVAYVVSARADFTLIFPHSNEVISVRLFTWRNPGLHCAERHGATQHVLYCRVVPLEDLCVRIGTCFNFRERGDGRTVASTVGVGFIPTALD